MKTEIINNFIEICGKKHVLTENWNKETYCKGWRYGSGEAIAVVKPGTLLEIWKVLNICNESNLIIIMQAANTGLTGGSTPYGENYDRDIVIINTMRINDIHLVFKGGQMTGHRIKAEYGESTLKAQYAEYSNSQGFLKITDEYEKLRC